MPSLDIQSAGARLQHEVAAGLRVVGDVAADRQRVVKQRRLHAVGVDPAAYLRPSLAGAGDAERVLVRVPVLAHGGRVGVVVHVCMQRARVRQCGGASKVQGAWMLDVREAVCLCAQQTHEVQPGATASWSQATSTHVRAWVDGTGRTEDVGGVHRRR